MGQLFRLHSPSLVPFLIAFVALYASSCGWAGAKIDEDFFGCAEGELTVGEPVSFSVDGMTPQVSGACTYKPEVQASFWFTAPAANYYRFTLDASGTSPSLYFSQVACGRSELGCHMADAGGAAEAMLPLEAGESVLVTADPDGRDADGVLGVEAVTCPDEEVDLTVSPLSGTLVGESDDHDGVCGGAGAGDRPFRFVGPSSGYFRFELFTNDPAFEAALYLEAGPACGGATLNCSASGAGRYAEVVAHLTTGEAITLWVDGVGSEGDFELRGTRVYSWGHPSEFLDDDGPDFTLPRDGQHWVRPSCSDGFFWPASSDDPDDLHLFPDMTVWARDFDHDASCVFRVHSRFAFTAITADWGSPPVDEFSCAAGVLEPLSPVDMPTYDLDLPIPAGLEGDARMVIDRTIASPDSAPDADGDSFSVQVVCASP